MTNVVVLLSTICHCQEKWKEQKQMLPVLTALSLIKLDSGLYLYLVSLQFPIITFRIRKPVRFPFLHIIRSQCAAYTCTASTRVDYRRQAKIRKFKNEQR